MEIISRENPLIKEWRRLTGDASARRESGKFVLEGVRLCGDAAHSGAVMDTVLYTAAAERQHPDCVEALRQRAARCCEIPESLASYISDTGTPQGVFCLCRRGEPSLTEEDIRPNGRYLALESVRDPGNVGTVIRTAEAFGADGLLLSADCCDVYNPKVLRGSMGGVLRLPMLVVPSLPELLARVKERGLRCFACVVDTEALPLPQAGLGAGCLCVIGNEANGLTPETAAACGNRLTIPMRGRAESLNASMAAGIILWELCR